MSNESKTCLLRWFEGLKACLRRVCLALPDRLKDLLGIQKPQSSSAHLERVDADQECSDDDIAATAQGADHDPDIDLDDVDYVNDCRAAILSNTSKVTRLFLYTVLTLLVLGVVWADNAIVDEVTHAEGKVVPSMSIRTIQNLEGGIIEKMMVREGQEVQQDQPLLIIDDTRYASRLNEEKTKLYALLATEARLQAEVKGKHVIHFPKDVDKRPKLRAVEVNLFKARLQNHLRAKSSMEKGLAFARHELNITKPLVDEGVMSKIELLRLQRQVTELEGKLEDHDNQYKQQAMDELSKLETKINASRELMKAYQDQMARTAINAPVRGIVKTIHVSSKGGVIQPGEDIMEIVPLDDNLLIEARIRPADVGFIYPKQHALVKISAYDYSIYGGLEGEVERIGADTVSDEQGETYYEVYVRTKKNYVEKGDKKLFIIPGMVATADLITGRKSILDYVLKPVLKVKQNALRER